MHLQRVTIGMVATLCCCSITTGQEHKQFHFSKTENRQEDGDFEHAGGNQTPAETVKKLNEQPVIPKRKWKMAGQATPQSTLETVMWAIRDQNEERFRACLSGPDGKIPTMEECKIVRDTVYAIQSQALRSTDNPDEVDLKFRWGVLGKGKTVVYARFKLVAKAWKMELTSTSYDADW